ncbi:ATP-binding protein (plasmid) [Arsenophonus nasoniae]|uniref:ATP-binding protein n=2 Tax=Arsenophonus nasoniae TaxID=638 RepID=A0A4P7L6T8_9GAMM|nr:ATP-binding protein [Arsenophonus nasoniae]QBY46004.1 DNA replication protein DnaC [Arsenophonus nasoniae]WGM08522.1 ATP-binding protein [Arsenophonus nasoniae]WGM13795.1 ATP-binding protein [Arsenophonus nasoniae]WGM18406.1 ATP-binding protein [Arsenophonus nasoniae]
MNTANGVLTRFLKLMPKHIKPKFNTVDELLAWHREQAKLDSNRISEENRVRRLNNIMGNSGISELYQHCTFDNFEALTTEQRQAKFKAKNYADNFGKYFGGFVFSGHSGTGKNHLAAAIGNHLIQDGLSILIVTFPELMMRLRKTYESAPKYTESQLIDDLCGVDLLVFDDVGVQRNNLNEGLVIFQIIDRRTSSKKPTGILTNLPQQQLTEVLGERIVDRLRMGKPTVVNFNWSSYRRKIQ